MSTFQVFMLKSSFVHMFPMFHGDFTTISHDFCDQVSPTSDVCWFINPMNTIVILTINHSYWPYNLYNLPSGFLT